MTAVDAVVITFDGRGLLEVALPSLAAQTHLPLRVIVVDDGSTDGTAAWLAEQWPDVTVVRHDDNRGVAAAYNAGIRAGSAPFVALLNNDLELAPDWAERMVAALEANPQASTIACKLLDYARRDRLDGAGDAVSWNGTARQRGRGQPDDGRYDQPGEVFAPTAGAALVRRSAFADVGLFDESLFAYFEDVDWGLRAQLRGHRCLYEPAAVGFHMGSATTGGAAVPRFYGLQRRNGIALLVKDVPARLLLENSWRIAHHQLGGLVLSRRAGMLGVHLRSLAAAARLLPRWLRARREIQRSRRVSLDRLRAIADVD